VEPAAQAGPAAAVVRTPFRHVVNLSDGGLSRWLGEQTKVQGIVKKPFPSGNIRTAATMRFHSATRWS